MTFQSGFGFKPWLLPATGQTIKSLPSAGVKHVQVICPGFAADCLKTLEEIKIKNQQIFKRAGGKLFHYIPALNDHPEHIEMFRQIIIKEL